MRGFTESPIPRKLLRVSILIGTVIILLLAAVISWNELVWQKSAVYRSRTEQLKAVAELIAVGNATALISNDSARAQQNLSALEADGNIMYAAIYRLDGERFAAYKTSHNIPVVPVDCTPQPAYQAQLLPICTPVWLGPSRIGEVYIGYDMGADLKQIKFRLLFYLVLLLLLALLAFVFAWLLSYRVQCLASGPLQALHAAINKVIKERDYAVRIAPTRPLATGFNEMLIQIQAREAELAQYSRNLEQQVQARNAELAESIRQRLLWLENLAYFLRHELKNSTLGIRSSLDLIERRMHTGDIAKYLQRARSSVAFMVKLLEKVGEASRLETDFDDETKLPLDLGQLVNQQIETYQAIYQNKTLLAQCQAGVKILGNSTRMIQLLDKLVSNAVDYSKPDAPIQITVKQVGLQAVLTVANEGTALPEDKQRIFELFVSQRDDAHKEGGNLGLGLYMVKLIAEAHGGTVSADDWPGRQGAVFTVHLPLV